MNASQATLSTAVALILTSGIATATDQSHTATLKFVYPQSTGDFILAFDSESALCSSTSTPKRYYVAVGQNGISAEGSKKIYAAALAALAAKLEVSIGFDDSTSSCYVNRLTLRN